MNNLSLTDHSVTQQIKTLYALESSFGQYEIICRTIFIIKTALEMGYSTKLCVDKMMDKGVKPLELGIALCMALKRVNPSKLNGVDSSIRIKILNDNKKMIEEFEKLEDGVDVILP